MEPLEQRAGWCLSLNLSPISCGCEKTPKPEKQKSFFFFLISCGLKNKTHKGVLVRRNKLLVTFKEGKAEEKF